MVGVEPRAVRVEAHIGGPRDRFCVVGLPDTAVREARDRVRAALAHSGFDLPVRQVTVNLAPADLPKQQNAHVGIRPARRPQFTKRLNEVVGKCHDRLFHDRGILRARYLEHRTRQVPVGHEDRDRWRGHSTGKKLYVVEHLPAIRFHDRPRAVGHADLLNQPLLGQALHIRAELVRVLAHTGWCQ